MISMIYSVYDDEFPGALHKDFTKKVMFEGIEKADLELYKNPTFVNLSKAAIVINKKNFVRKLADKIFDKVFVKNSCSRELFFKSSRLNLTHSMVPYNQP